VDEQRTIGQSVVIKGELLAKEDLNIEGQVEGTVQLDSNVLTIGANGKLQAQISAKTVVVMGKVNGNISASETINIREGAWVEGDVVAPRVGIAEGAHFKGTIDMKASAERKELPTQSPPKPVRVA